VLADEPIASLDPRYQIFAFPDVKWEPGTLTAIGFKNNKEACRHELVTSGPPKRIKLTQVGPVGLNADGSDVALFDVEVVDDAPLHAVVEWLQPEDRRRLEL
jgi:beta-galactosidase